MFVLHQYTFKAMHITISTHQLAKDEKESEHTVGKEVGSLLGRGRVAMREGETKPSTKAVLFHHSPAWP